MRQTLHRLRQALNEDDAQTPFIIATQETVQFNRNSDYWLDLDAFSALLEACAAHTHRRIQACLLCGERLQQATALYRGDFLTDFFLENSPTFEAWAQARRQHYQLQLITSLHQLAAFHESRAQFGAMLEAAQRALDLDELDEVAHRQYMRAQALSGRRNLALARHRQFCQQLLAELGALPEAETTSVFEQVQVGTLSAWAVPARENLPVPATSLVGRDGDLAELAQLIANPANRLITLAGPGGVGKTRLAIELARTHATEFESGACFVSLAPIQGSDWVAPAIIQSLVDGSYSVRSEIAPPDDRQPWLSLQKFLRNREMLLILDNFEHVMGAAPQLTLLLAQCPRLTCLVTSREALRLGGELAYTVPTLQLPEPGAVRVANELVQFPSTALFVERLPRSVAAGGWRADDAPAIADLCRLLDGLPLAIELAAATTTALAPGEILQRLKAQGPDRQQILSQGARDQPSRHQTMRGAIQWSYELLTPAEQALLRRLAVFASGFTLEAAEAVCPDEAAPADAQVASGLPAASIADLMTALVNKSLLQRLPGPAGASRFAMLHTVREFALDQLALQDDAPQWHRRHAQYLVSLAERAERAMTGPDVGWWSDRLKQEQDDLLAALDWCARQPDAVELFLRLAGALAQYFQDTSSLQEGLEWLTRAIARSEELTEREAEPLQAWRAKVLRGAGALAYSLTYAPRAEKWLLDSLQIYQRLGDRRNAAYALYELAAVYRHDLARAWPVVEQAQQLAREAGDPHGLASAPYYFGILATDHGEWRRAIELFEESLALFRQSQDKRGMAWATTKLAALERDRLGNYTRAAELFEQNAATFRDLRDNLGVAISLLGLGRVRLYAGDGWQANAHFLAAQTLLKEIGANVVGAMALMNLGEAALYLDRDLDKAGALFSEAHDLYVTAENAYGIAWSLSDLADAEFGRGEYARARHLQLESLRRRAAIGDKEGLAFSLEGLAYVLAAQGEAAEAARLLGAAAALREACGALLPSVAAGLYQQNRAVLREQLGPETFDQLYRAGASADVQVILAAVLARTPIHEPDSST